MMGEEALRQLQELAATWPQPRNGRYTETPAETDEDGIVELRAKPFAPLAAGFYGTAAVLGAAAVLTVIRKRNRAA